jgi:hypothetical protein
MESINLSSLWEKAQEVLAFMEPLHIAIASAVLLLLLLILFFRASRRKQRRRLLAPALLLESYQVSPLGRDAFLKIKNTGEMATFISLTMKGRQDIAIKNAFAGHQLEKGKSYALMLEATTSQKLNADFTLELTYMDTAGNVYRQALAPGQRSTRQPKLVKARG